MSVVFNEKCDDPVFPTDIPKAIVTPPAEKNERKIIGILDIKPSEILSPPEFTEEATLLAMKNLSILPEELVLSDESKLKLQEALDAEKKRFELIRQIVKERNRIIDAIESLKPKKRKKKKMRNKKRISRIPKKGGRRRKKTKPKTTEMLVQGSTMNFIDEYHMLLNNMNQEKQKISSIKQLSKESDIPVEKQNVQKSPRMEIYVTSFGKSKIPIPVKQFRNNNNNESFKAMQTKRLHSFISQRMIERQQNALFIKKQKDNEKRQLAERALERVKEVEERQMKIKQDRVDLLKQKARIRLEKMKRNEDHFEKIKQKKKYEAEAEVKYRERMFKKLQQKKKRQFEKEKRQREENIYGKQLGKANNESYSNRFSKLRQKIIAVQNENSLSPSLNTHSINEPKSNSKNSFRASSNSKKSIIHSDKQMNNGYDPYSFSQKSNEDENCSKIPKPRPVLDKSRKNMDYKSLITLPVVGDKKTKIPFYRKKEKISF